MKSGEVSLREPGSPPTSDTTILASPGEDFSFDALARVKEYAELLKTSLDEMAMALPGAALARGYITWFPGNTR